MTVTELVETAALWIEATGVLVIVLAVATTLMVMLVAAIRGQRWSDNSAEGRRRIGRGLLLGLEILVAGDIIRTVAVDLSLRSVAVLGGIVLIRTFLSWTIEAETEGRWPWHAA